MKKEMITVEELALLSFLKFDRFDIMDITVLKDMISNSFELVIDDVCDDYFVINDGTIIVEDSYIERLYKKINRELLEKIRKTNLYKYLSNISIIEFVLRKIRLIGEGALVVDDVENSFGSFQTTILDRLYKDGYIMQYRHIDKIYGDYQAIKLTKRGDLYLYIKDNEEKIDKFSNMLKELGCDELLIPSFLIAQDLDKNIEEILTVNNFMNFCYEYGFSIFSKKDDLKLKKQKNNSY